LSSELVEDRKEGILGSLLQRVLKIKIKERYSAQSRFAQFQNVFDNRGAIQNSVIWGEGRGSDAYEMILFPDPAVEPSLHQSGKSYKSCVRVRLPWIHKTELVVDFHSAKVLPWINHSALPSW